MHHDAGPLPAAAAPRANSSTAGAILIAIHAFSVSWLSQTHASAQSSTDTPSGQAERDEIERPRDLSGPTSPEHQVARDRAEGIELYRLPFLEGYYDWKARIAEEYGFSYGVDYTAVGLESNHSLAGTDEYAYGGLARAYGAWELFGRGTATPGVLTWRVTTAHSYTDTAPSGFALGSLGKLDVIDPVHDDAGTKLANLYWRQSWESGAYQLIGGYFDAADLFEFYALTDPFTAFRSLVFLNGVGTIPLPSAGSLGAVAGAWVNDQIYLAGGIVDSNGDPKDPDDGFDTFFNDNEYFTFAELGWTTSPEKVYLDNVHLTLWHVDEREDAGTEEGHGAVFSFSRYLDNSYMPFLKAGYADDGSSLLEKSVSVGVGYQPSPVEGVGNLLGLGVNWGEPNSSVFGSGLNDQYSTEVFYRWQVSKEFALTPNVQAVIDPALNPDDDTIWVFGLRARLSL
jgi:porin